VLFVGGALLYIDQTARLEKRQENHPGSSRPMPPTRRRISTSDRDQ